MTAVNGSTHFRQQRRSAGAILLVAMLTVVSLVIAHPSAGDEPGLRLVEVIDNPWSDQPSRSDVLAVDGPARRLYATVVARDGGRRIAEYDISDRSPKPLRLAADPLPNVSISPAKTVIDSERGQLAFIADGSVETEMILYDLATLEPRTPWNLRTTLPGFVPRGMTYDTDADRFYLVGEFTGTMDVVVITGGLGRPVTPGPSMVALDGATGDVVWVHALPECTQVLNHQTEGATVGLSSRRPALYVFCDGGTVFTVPTGQSALIRVMIDPDATMASSAEFTREVFPVSGLYFGGNPTLTGVAAFDPARERMFVQSIARSTAGGWVFDGLQSAWVGFVAAPNNNNYRIGLNRANGRYYMGGALTGDPSSGFLNVTDGRATPMAQGTLSRTLFPKTQLHPDPLSNRVFTSASIMQGDPPEFVPDPRGGAYTPLVVIEDTTRPILPPLPRDLDALTSDLPDDQARLTYSGSVEGFAASYIQVGGWEGVAERGNVALRPPNVAGLALGDRGARMAVVPRLDIRQGGASATAAAGATDQATASDGSDAGQETGLGSSALEFPYGVQTCLDGGGDRTDTAEGAGGDPGYARVVCDLDAGEAIAEAAFSDGASAGGVSVGSGTFDSRTFHDPERGTVTETIAVAEGIKFGDPAVATIGFDRVTVRVTTVANGRPGTTAARWERIIEGAVIQTPAGAQAPQDCRTVVEAGKDPVDEGDCDGLAAAINQALPKTFTMQFPEPTAEATPMGAFAAIEQEEAAYLHALTLNNETSRAVPGVEIEVRYDTQTKSRLYVQLAAVRANSTFTRSAVFTSGPIDNGHTVDTSPPPAVDSDQPSGPSTTGQVPLPPIDQSGGDASPPDLAPREPDLPTVAAPGPSLVGASGWVPGLRSLGDALLAGGLYLLLLVPLVETLRRRRLLAVLQASNA